MGNERERGECAVMEAGKVRNLIRGRGLGRRCRRCFSWGVKDPEAAAVVEST
jgi:hypothetical protein